MDPGRWHKIDELFHAAIDCPRGERDQLLRYRCGNDAALKSEIESLLVAHEGSSYVIDSRAFEVAAHARTTGEPGWLAGAMIGGYRICGFIGSGGGGAVYEAEQDSPRRKVAFKLRRALPFGDELTARMFQREGQALARLQHPCIAAIYEAGQTDDGWHYFAMERVSGAPLLEYVHAQNLSLQARLSLFKQICEAVHYAHQRGVIHRDLKPSNILVTQEGLPKILDFGLARVQDLEATQLSVSGAFQGTIAYASPEQVRGRSDDIDVRTDVYSLGVILFELTTGELPYKTNGVTLADACRVVCEEAPRLAGTLRRELRGDIETIAGKALEKEPARRYDSAAALGDDVGRFLNGRPIQARASSTFYHLYKFINRNRIASAVVAALLIGLVILALVNGWLAKRYADQRDAATLAASEERVARRSADEVTDFIESVLAGANPFAAGSREPTLGEIVSSAESRLVELKDEPLVYARVLASLGKVQRSLANYDRSREHLRAALETRRGARGPDHPDVAASLIELSALATETGDHVDAISKAESALAITEKAHGRGHKETAAALESLGTAQYRARKFDAAILSFQAALDIQRSLGDGDSAEVANSLINLGSALHGAKRTPDGLQLMREALAIRERLFGDSHQVCHALQNIAQLTFGSDRAETEALLARRLEISRRIYHANHPAIAAAANDLAYLVRQRDMQAAAVLYNEALEIRREAMGSNHPLVAATLHDLAALCNDRGDHVSAEKAHREALEIRRKHFGERDVRVSDSLNSLSVTYQRLGKFSEAAPLAELVIDIWREVYGPADVRIAVAHQTLAAIRVSLRQFELAEEHLRAADEIYRALKHPQVAQVMRIRGSVHLFHSRLNEAEAIYREAVDTFRAYPQPNPIQLSDALNDLGIGLDLNGKVDESRGVLREAIELRRKVFAPGDAALLDPVLNLAEIQLREDQTVDAELLDHLAAIEPKLMVNSPPRGNLLGFRGQQALIDNRPDDALPLLQEALKIHETRWGADHWRTATTRARLGEALARSGNSNDARKPLASAVKVLNDTLGQSHPKTKAAANALARLAESGGQAGLQQDSSQVPDQ